MFSRLVISLFLVFCVLDGKTQTVSVSGAQALENMRLLSKKADVGEQYAGSDSSDYFTAMVFYDEKNYDSADYYIQSSLKRNPIQPYAHYLSGKIYYVKNNLVYAAESFSKAISLKMDMAKAYNDRGTVYKKMGNYDLSLADYTEAIRLLPSAVYYGNRASLKVRQEDYEGAIEDYTEALRLDSSYYFALNNRGEIYLRMRMYDCALKDLTSCIKIKPDYPYAYNNRGIVYYKMRRYSESLKDFDKAIELKPEFGLAYMHRGNVEEMIDDEVSACADWIKAESLGVSQASFKIGSCNCRTQ